MVKSTIYLLLRHSYTSWEKEVRSALVLDPHSNGRNLCEADVDFSDMTSKSTIV